MLLLSKKDIAFVAAFHLTFAIIAASTALVAICHYLTNFPFGPTILPGQPSSTMLLLSKKYIFAIVPATALAICHSYSTNFPFGPTILLLLLVLGWNVAFAFIAFHLEESTPQIMYSMWRFCAIFQVFSRLVLGQGIGGFDLSARWSLKNWR
jgi:hypothetical protein